MDNAPKKDVRLLVERLIKEIAGAAQARGMYGAAHKLSRESVARLIAVLGQIFTDREDLTIGIVGEEIVFEKEPFYDLSRTAGGFVAGLKEAKIDKITFLRTPAEKELDAFLDAISRPARVIDERGGVDKMLDAGGVSHIMVGRIGFDREGLLRIAAGDLASMAKSVFDDGSSYLEKTFDNIRQNKPIDISAARFFVIRLIGSLARNKQSLLMLTSIKTHDESTFIHSINVAIFAVVQAESLGLSDKALTEIGIAGLLHDTGKLVLSGDLLRKRESLNKQDIEDIHRHPVDGAKLLIQSLEGNPLAAISAFEHHIRYDQTGYPQRLFGGPVNPASMLVTIADVYDALRSKRPYHEDMAPEKTYDEMMKFMGTNFDPKLLMNFFRIVGVFPPGTLVELDDHSIGIVLRESATDIRRPQIELLYGPDGSKMPSGSIVNLLEQDRASGQFRRGIVKSLSPGKYDIPARFKV